MLRSSGQPGLRAFSGRLWSMPGMPGISTGTRSSVHGRKAKACSTPWSPGPGTTLNPLGARSARD